MVGDQEAGAAQQHQQPFARTTRAPSSYRSDPGPPRFPTIASLMKPSPNARTVPAARPQAGFVTQSPMMASPPIIDLIPSRVARPSWSQEGGNPLPVTATSSRANERLFPTPTTRSRRKSLFGEFIPQSFPPTPVLRDRLLPSPRPTSVSRVVQACRTDSVPSEAISSLKELMNLISPKPAVSSNLVEKASDQVEMDSMNDLTSNVAVAPCSPFPVMEDSAIVPMDPIHYPPKPPSPSSLRREVPSSLLVSLSTPSETQSTPEAQLTSQTTVPETEQERTPTFPFKKLPLRRSLRKSRSLENVPKEAAKSTKSRSLEKSRSSQNPGLEALNSLCVEKWFIELRGSTPFIFGTDAKTRMKVGGKVLERIERSLLVITGEKKLQLGTMSSKIMKQRFGANLLKIFHLGFPSNWKQLLISPEADLADISPKTESLDSSPRTDFLGSSQTDLLDISPKLKLQSSVDKLNTQPPKLPLPDNSSLSDTNHVKPSDPDKSVDTVAKTQNSVTKGKTPKSNVKTPNSDKSVDVAAKTQNSKKSVSKTPNSENSVHAMKTGKTPKPDVETPNPDKPVDIAVKTQNSKKYVAAKTQKSKKSVNVAKTPKSVVETPNLDKSVDIVAKTPNSEKSVGGKTLNSRKSVHVGAKTQSLKKSVTKKTPKSNRSTGSLPRRRLTATSSSPSKKIKEEPGLDSVPRSSPNTSKLIVKREIESLQELPLDEMQGVRKSQSGRRCIQPLKYWLTERIISETGTICTVPDEPTSTKSSRKRARTRTPRSSVSKRTKTQIRRRSG